MRDASPTDRRRDAGARTKQRLLDATLALLAERGEDAVTLRDITAAAHTNVASVSYHFGSLGALCCATAKLAIAQLLDDQLTRLRALGADATVEQIARSIAQPVIEVLSEPDSPERAALRIFDRALGAPPSELQEWLRGQVARVDDELIARLGVALPGVSADELRFRWECASGILRGLATGTGRCNLEGRGREELERLLIPVIAGALAAGVPAPAA